MDDPRTDSSEINYWDSESDSELIVVATGPDGFKRVRDSLCWK